MSTKFRHIPQDAIIPHTAEETLTQYAAIFQGAAVDGAIMPTGADLASGFRGVAMHGATAGQRIDLAGQGSIIPMKSAAAFAKGAQLSAADVQGRVHALPALGAGVSALVIAEALEAATGADELVSCLVRVYRVTGA